ncbi:unnamed protein product [Schistosoma margrebowiei]|uniref:SBF2 domain-containing protein n=1 Tax=Schistosoma margrebowiei TaxID=48269 RepID=A0AA84ZTQ8_9TREM|nr:unnamed protein product [Schistosoma margrebowiei]
MSFGNFLRRISFDSEKVHTDSSDPEGNDPPGMNSFFTSPSRIFESVNAKTGHLVSDLNQKLDISGKLDSIKQVSVGKLEHVVRGSSGNRSDSKDETQKDDIIENIPRMSYFDQDVRDSTTNLSSQAPFNNRTIVDLDKSQTEKSTGYVHYSPSCDSQRSEESHLTSSGSALRRQSTQNTPRPPRPPPPSSAALSRAMSLDETNLSAQMKSSSFQEDRNQLTDEQPVDQKLKYPAKDRGQPFKLIDEPRVLQQPSASVIEEEENSSASEYGENGDQPIYKQERDLILAASGQTSSTTKSYETQNISTEDKTFAPPCPTVPNTPSIEKIQEFMDLYTSALIIGRSDYLKSKENELQELLIMPAGRIAFVNALEQESRRTQGLVDLQALPKLLDQISLLLVECQNAEDFQPAKKLLSISLKFYTYDPSVSTDRTFIFAYIKSQPIWQSLRFWNACFFQSLQEARSKAEESSYDSTKVSSSTTYEQLKSYLQTMNVFSLHETIKQEFLRKQADLFNLNDDEISSLLSVISSAD